MCVGALESCGEDLALREDDAVSCEEQEVLENAEVSGVGDDEDEKAGCEPEGALCGVQQGPGVCSAPRLWVGQLLAFLTSCQVCRLWTRVHDESTVGPQVAAR
mmetsp:Transcript_25246/g.30567  ORF Transcript_25246/g.30567 Transcript_25246/m.30567 type:complete len:103 (+) Transcript_25246:1262-1570(+)